MMTKCDMCDRDYGEAIKDADKYLICPCGHVNHKCPHCGSSFIEIDDEGLYGCWECTDQIAKNHKLDLLSQEAAPELLEACKAAFRGDADYFQKCKDAILKVEGK